MKKAQTKNISLIKSLNYFLVFYLGYILVGYCIIHLIMQEANQALVKAPEDKKLEVISERMRLYSQFL